MISKHYKTNTRITKHYKGVVKKLQKKIRESFKKITKYQKFPKKNTKYYKTNTKITKEFEKNYFTAGRARQKVVVLLEGEEKTVIQKFCIYAKYVFTTLCACKIQKKVLKC